MQKDITTEEKIKEAARKVFHEKGYGLTRTRDIAEEAGINLALLNYYFRSKENLFDIIMIESMQEMFSIVRGIINDEETSLSVKIDLVTERYIGVILDNQNLPLFVFTEIQANPGKLLDKIMLPKNLLIDSYFYTQLDEWLKKKSIDIQPLHIFLNIISLCIFPVISKPMLTCLSLTDEENFKLLIDQRRKLIPVWIKEMIKLED